MGGIAPKFFLALSILAIPARAGVPCLKRLLGASASPRTTAQETLQEQLRLEEQTTFFHANSGRHLSSTQQEAARIRSQVNAFLRLGSTAPIELLYSNKVRQLETAFFQREKNLLLLQELKTLESGLAVPLDQTRRLKLIAKLEKWGIVSSASVALFKEADTEELRHWLEREQNKLTQETLQFESVIGKRFDEWKAIRGSVHSLLQIDLNELLARVESNDNRAKIPEPSPQMDSVHIAAAELPKSSFRALAPQVEPSVEQQLLERENQFQRKIEEAKQRRLFVERLLAGVRGRTTDWATVHNELGSAKLLNESLRLVLARPPETAEAEMGNKWQSLEDQLTLLSQRLGDAVTLLSQAAELEKSLEIGREENPLFASIFARRLVPSEQEVERLVLQSATAQRARLRRERWSALLSFLDGTLTYLYSTAGSAVPALGKLAQLTKIPGLEKFLYTLFEDLYLAYAEKNHFPSLTLLAESPGDPGKLLGLLKTLNAGTRDQLLKVFARRADLSTLWATVKNEAKVTQNSDHLDFLNRMLAAEEQAKKIGDISMLNGGRYTRYLIAALIDGAVLYGAGHLSIMLGIVSDNAPANAQSTSWWHRIAQWALPSAWAQGPPLRSVRVHKYTEEMEDQALDCLEHWARALAAMSAPRPTELAVAAQSLLRIETQLSGRPTGDVLAGHFP